MSGTPNFNIPYLAPAQSQPSVTINEALDVIDDALANAGGNALAVKEVGHSPAGDVHTVRELHFIGATVTPQSNGVALIQIDAPSDSGDGGGGSASPLTTKGDVYVYGSSDARLAVGSNGKVLTADSTQATGLAWQTPTGSDAWTINAQSGSAYTLQVADENQTYIRMTSSSPNALNVPTNAAQAIAVGSLIRGYQAGDGQTTITPASGVTVNTPTDYLNSARAKGSFWCLMKIGTNAWDLWGDLEYTSTGGGGGGMPGPFDLVLPTDSFSGFDITVGS